MARKQKMKVYHGIPKSITDEHTILYSSFDGNTQPFSPKPSTSYKPTCTGYGVDLKNSEYFESNILNFDDVVTIDLLYTYTSKGNVPGNAQYLVRLSRTNETTFKALRIRKDKNELHFSAYINDSNLGSKVIQTLEEDKTYHFRLVLDGYKSTVYVNGVKKLDTTDTLTCKKLDYVGIGLASGGWGVTGIYSDLHISNVDRGDYFPNLPQDFIDGKAVIKPKMGQQQIKGDPMYSQTTTVKIPAFTNETSKLYCRYDNNTKGYLVDNPEIFDVVNANEWNQGSKFKIKGLNEEIIGGVIDTNTALCKILSFGDGKINSNETSNKRVLKVSTTKGLEPTDIVTLNNTLTPGGTSALVRTIDSVDTINNLITLREDVISSNILSYYLFETTASSSSPTVKIKNGTTVQGVWSGLGTTEASFTLGANTGLQGQDLYVEYSLTMPYGNSDFPELPHTVERAWGENGVEMKPVNEIVITDDFRHKIIGRDEECPHFMGWHFSPTPPPPSTFTENDKQAHYDSVKHRDTSTRTCTTSNVGIRARHLFSFDLIKMVESKLGLEIPSTNKIQWLKDNITNITFNAYAYSTSSTGNTIYCTVYFPDNSTWSDGTKITSDYVTLVSNTTTTPTVLPRIIDPKGKVHFQLATRDADGVTASTLYTDYAEIQIFLKNDSTFTTLYCENTRAREDKCNPVLIQKETKTVKRYLPSKECFTTESLYVSQPQSAGNISGDASRSTLIEDPYIYICSLGTGFVSPTTEFYRDCLSNIGDSYIKSILCNLNGSVLEVNLNNSLRFTRVPCTTSNGNNKYVLPSKYFEGEYLCIKPFLTVKNKELMVTLSLRHMRNGTHLYHTEREYNITNKPLIK